MVAGLAHELNNSLQVVSGLVELLGDGAGLPPDALARVRKIGGQAEKASRRDPPGGDLHARAGPGDGGGRICRRWPSRRWRFARYNLGRAGIAAAADLPPAPVLVTGDGRTVLQMLLNLVLNAEEALADSRGAAAARRRARKRLLAPDRRERHRPRRRRTALRERIFEPFFTTRPVSVPSVWDCRWRARWPASPAGSSRCTTPGPARRRSSWSGRSRRESLGARRRSSWRPVPAPRRCSAGAACR